MRVLFVCSRNRAAKRVHKTKLSRKFGSDLKCQRIACLDFSCRDDFTEQELIVRAEKNGGEILKY